MNKIILPGSSVYLFVMMIKYDMVTIDEMESMLDEMASELPLEFFEYLNGGIMLLPEIKFHNKSRRNDLVVLGEYHQDKNMGRYIVIYYGSFSRLFSHLSKEDLSEKLKGTLKHEFRHHLETLSGEKGLSVRDAEDIARYLGQKY